METHNHTNKYDSLKQFLVEKKMLLFGVFFLFFYREIADNHPKLSISQSSEYTVGFLVTSVSNSMYVLTWVGQQSLF